MHNQTTIVLWEYVLSSVRNAVLVVRADVQGKGVSAVVQNRVLEDVINHVLQDVQSIVVVHVRMSVPAMVL